MAGDEFEAMRMAKQNAKARLFAIPGVHAVGIGPKQVAGQPTAQLAIIVYLLEKKPLANVPAEQRIPAQIDGYPTDVVQAGMPSQSAAKADDVGEINDILSKPRPLIGGVQMIVSQSATAGTLGFLATRSNGEVFAVTNWHVVAPGYGIKTNLVIARTATPEGLELTFSKTGSDPIPDGSVAVLSISGIAGTPTGYDYYAQSASGDTFEDVAQTLTNEINGVPGTGITASRTNEVVTVTDTTSSTKFQVLTIGPTRPDPNCELLLKATKNTVTLSGVVPGENHGILLAVNSSGAEHATAGLFLPVSKGEAPTAIATRLAQAFKALNPSFTATVSGKTVTFSPASQIDVFAWPDVRAAQPQPDFATGCSDCCVDEIGSTFQADYGLDAAIVRLNPERVEKYLAEVKDIGFISGAHEVQVPELVPPYTVKKRGKKTGVRTGKIEAIDLDGLILLTGHIPAPPGAPPDYVPPVGPPASPRKFDGAMRITSTVSPSTLFSSEGDSGAAILHETASGGWDVVGLLFGGIAPEAGDPTPPYSLATRIQPILQRFNITVATATAMGQEKTVPQPQGARSVVGRPASQEQTSATEVWASVSMQRQLLSASVTGRAHLATVIQNLREVNALINQNRRVGVAWQRNGGPIMMHGFLQAVRDPDLPLPAEIMGESWAARVNLIAAEMRVHGSEELKRALNGTTWDFIAGLGGKSSRDVQAQLQRLDAELAELQRDPLPLSMAPAPPPGE